MAAALNAMVNWHAMLDVVMHENRNQICMRVGWHAAAVLFLTLLMMSLPDVASAGEGAAGKSTQLPGLPDDCAPEAFVDFPVRTVADSENVVLDDGRELNVGVLTAGLDDPAANSVLHDLVTGRALTLAAPGPSQSNSSDRYGRLLGNATIKIGDDIIWLQGALVAQGVARTTFIDNTRCGQKTLLRLEDRARRKELGHWSTGVFSVLDANDAKSVAARTGQFAIIEGSLRRRSKSRKGIYYNFGRNWREDVTVFVPARLLNSSTRPSKRRGRGADRSDRPNNRNAAMDQGLRITTHRTRFRTRGWIEDRGGPLIEIRHLDQIEWIE